MSGIESDAFTLSRTSSLKRENGALSANLQCTLAVAMTHHEVRMVTEVFSECELARLESEQARGLSSEAIVALFSEKGFRFTEATLRKYVQLGLLPRSRRVGMEGNKRGSQGLYPVTVVRRIQRLKAMLGKYTIDQIQRDFLFVRADVEELERTLERIFAVLEKATGKTKGDGAPRIVHRELTDARALAGDLVAKVTSVETRLTMQAGIQREAI